MRQLIRIHEPFRVLKDWDVLDFDLPELALPDGDLDASRDLAKAIASKASQKHASTREKAARAAAGSRPGGGPRTRTPASS